MSAKHPALKAVIAVALVILSSAVSVYLWGEKPEKVEFPDITVGSANVTPAQIAASNGIPLKPVLDAVGVSLADADSLTIADAGLSPKAAASRIKQSLVHYYEEKSKNWVKIAAKFLLWFAFLPIPFVLLVKRRLNPKRRRLLLVAGTIIFGVALGADPSPMGTVKDAVFLLTAHQAVFPPRMIALGVFLLTVVLANKFICSWGCQFGLLQDTLFRFGRNFKDRKGKIRQFKVPFIVSNSIRIGIFLLAVAIGMIWAFDLIGLIDPFKIFSPLHIGIVGGVFLLLLLAASLFVWRPWCHFACPFGLVSWFFERLAIFRIKVDYNACTRCDACSISCPSHAMDGILKHRKMPADCFACGVCIETCPTDAVSFSASRRDTGRWNDIPAPAKAVGAPEKTT
jgi:NAD-dependent dihydropyrimidine dehydrogenase PreA subunit